MLNLEDLRNADVCDMCLYTHIHTIYTYEGFLESVQPSNMKNSGIYGQIFLDSPHIFIDTTWFELYCMEETHKHLNLAHIHIFNILPC